MKTRFYDNPYIRTLFWTLVIWVAFWTAIVALKMGQWVQNENANYLYTN